MDATFSKSAPTLRILQLLIMALLLNMVVAAEEPRRGPSTIDLNRITDVLSSGGYSTVIPKRCVLYLPENLKSKVARIPNQKHARFSEFYRKNQGWIFKMELSMAEARGDRPISKEKLDRAKMLGKMILAVHNGHPIAVRKPKPVEKEPELVEIRR